MAPNGALLAAVDGSNAASRAASAAADIARRWHGELHVVHAGQPLELLAEPGVHGRLSPREEVLEAEAHERLDGEITRLTAAGYRVDQQHIALGAPAEVILDTSETIKPALMVVGVRGLGATPATEAVGHQRLPALESRAKALEAEVQPKPTVSLLPGIPGEMLLRAASKPPQPGCWPWAAEDLPVPGAPPRSTMASTDCRAGAAICPTIETGP